MPALCHSVSHTRHTHMNTHTYVPPTLHAHTYMVTTHTTYTHIHVYHPHYIHTHTCVPPTLHTNTYMCTHKHTHINAHTRTQTHLSNEDPPNGISNWSIYPNHVKLQIHLIQTDNLYSEPLYCTVHACNAVREDNMWLHTHIPAPTAYYPMCTSYTIIYSIQRWHESGVWVGRCRRCVSGAGLQLAAQPLHLAISDRAWCVNCQHSVDTAVEASLKCKQVR